MDERSGLFDSQGNLIEAQVVTEVNRTPEPSPPAVKKGRTKKVVTEKSVAEGMDTVKQKLVFDANETREVSFTDDEAFADAIDMVEQTLSLVDQQLDPGRKGTKRPKAPVELGNLEKKFR